MSTVASTLAVVASAAITLIAPQSAAAGARIEWRTPTFVPVEATPVVAGGRVFVVDGAVSALDAASGRRLWRAALGELAPRCLLVVGEQVIAASEEVVAFDAALGAERWRWMPPANTSLGCPAASGERVLVGTAAGEVIGLDTSPTISAGARAQWTAHIGDGTLATRAVVRGLTVAGGVAYVAAEQWRTENGHSVMGWIAAVDVSTGRLRWQVSFGANGERRGASASPQVTGSGIVIVPDALGNALIAFDASDGTERWTFRGARDAVGFASRPEFSDGTLLIAASGDGHVYALAAESGALRWRAALPGGAISAVTCSGRVFADYQGLATLDTEGHVLARQLDDDGDFVAAGLTVAEASVFAAGPRAIYRLACVETLHARN